MVQTDYKKVLAYSTVSQLGFMMLGLGVGGWAAGLFHLLTHAFFKALLFLGAGSVYHASTPTRCRCWAACARRCRSRPTRCSSATLAISGVPFFSGFYSKDAILAASICFGSAQSPRAHPALPPAGGRGDDHGLLHVPDVVPGLRRRARGFRPTADEVATTTATATTHGKPRTTTGTSDPHDHDPAAHAHESEPLMTWPLIVLAVSAIIVGWPLVGLPLRHEPVLEQMLDYGEPRRARSNSRLGRTGWRWRLAPDRRGRASAWACSSTPRRPAVLRPARGSTPPAPPQRFRGLYDFLVAQVVLRRDLRRPLRPARRLALRAALRRVRPAASSTAWSTARRASTVRLSRLEGRLRPSPSTAW